MKQEKTGTVSCLRRLLKKMSMIVWEKEFEYMGTNYLEKNGFETVVNKVADIEKSFGHL